MKLVLSLKASKGHSSPHATVPLPSCSLGDWDLQECLQSEDPKLSAHPLGQATDPPHHSCSHMLGEGCGQKTQ